jgi:hypothetical protein
MDLHQFDLLQSEEKKWEKLCSQIQKYFQFFSNLTPTQLLQVKLKQDILQDFKNLLKQIYQVISWKEQDSFQLFYSQSLFK